MRHVISAARAIVVMREDVIECPSDPAPNAFFDSNAGILRVYHGPVYGNPYASILPSRGSNQMPIGAFSGYDQTMGYPPSMQGPMCGAQYGNGSGMSQNLFPQMSAPSPAMQNAMVRLPGIAPDLLYRIRFRIRGCLDTSYSMRLLEMWFRC